MEPKKKDVAVYGLWYGNNYGSIITYYALSKVLEEMRFTYSMIWNPLGRELDIDSLEDSHPLKFAVEKYDITPRLGLGELGKLNSMFDAFLIGSDQMWNYDLSRPYKQSYFFDFVEYSKNKIAYGTSFGRGQYKGTRYDVITTKHNLERFNTISVRDDFSREILEKTFGMKGTKVADPVFLCDSGAYMDLVREAAPVPGTENPYIFAYILDPNPQIGEELRKVAAERHQSVIVIYDQHAYLGRPDNEIHRARLGLRDEDPIKVLDDPTVKQWLLCINGADFVLTDSFHGACFSIIFKKDFIVLKNNRRGGLRFPELLGTFGITKRMTEKDTDFYRTYMQLEKEKELHIDYTKVIIKLDEYKKMSWDFLENALRNPPRLGPEKPAVLKSQDLHPDIQRCQMVAGLLRDYHVRHVVVSSGARDVSLARLFEANDCFVTHNVTDERSAAYYALGLATRLKEPVAITCTSGTAVSNYLPGITEAYHMQVPIVVISGDRYPYFLGQMEAQKTDHIGALRSVVKKSVDLQIGWDGMIQWDTRRKISEALLEMTHHGAGPVHINVPMSYLENRFPPEEALILPKYRHISRIEWGSPSETFDETLAKLKKAQRILLISGQALPMGPGEQEVFDRFCSKFNCAVITDHLSNLHNEYTVNPFNLLRLTDRNFFEKNLKPDLVLYFGGKRVLNDPLQEKMRSLVRTFEFWRIDPDGQVADLYRTLTHVYEMEPVQFFRYFADRAGDNHNNGVYFDIWKKQVEAHPQFNYKNAKDFSSYYTIGGVMANIPKNSIVHLGVGTAFNRAHVYDLDPSVTVYCNMGTNGIDGSASTFMGQAWASDCPCFLFIGDLSFFYDMNSVWNKPLKGNIRILMNNDGGAGFLRHFATAGITQAHNAAAKGWVESLGFTYLCAHNREEYDANLARFVSDEDTPMFFETFVV